MYVTLIFFLMLILPIIVMPKHMLSGRYSPHRIVMQATIAIGAGILVMFMAAALTGEGVYSQVQAAVDVLAEQAAAIPQITEMLGISELGRDGQIDAIAQVYDRSAMLMPVSLMFMGAVIAYLEYLILSRLLAKRGSVRRMPPLRELSFPHGTAMAVMLMYLTAWAFSMEGTDFGRMLYMNVNMLFDLVFSIQGISVVLMLFYLKRLPGAAGIVVAVIMWATSIGRVCLILLGMTDMILGVKARMRGSSVRKS